MDSQQKGASLNQLARFMFDAAARKWYWALLLEIIASAISVGLSMTQLPGEFVIVGAIVSIALLVWAYIYRLLFDFQYDTAEAMRRQSVLTEALGWPVNTIQISRWMQVAGEGIRAKLNQYPRDDNYYATSEKMGARRLLDMTAESAFYTRHLYLHMKSWAWKGFITICLVFALALTIAAAKAIPDNMAVAISRVILGLIPVVLGVNLLGWAMRLNRLAEEVCQIEEKLEELSQQKSPELARVLGFVAEYNCQVVQGIPIPNILFRRWQDEIADLWEQSRPAN